MRFPVVPIPVEFATVIDVDATAVVATARVVEA
jgi:hypothetical protein